MPKYELIEEKKINGDVFYSIERDGVYVDHSLCLELPKAEKIFNDIIEGKVENKITIHKSVEI